MTDCPAPRVWDRVIRPNGSTYFVLRCEVCGLCMTCDPKRVTE